MHSHKADRFLPTHSRTAAVRDAAEAMRLAKTREDIETQLAQMTHLIDDLTDRARVRFPFFYCTTCMHRRQMTFCANPAHNYLSCSPHI